VNTRISRVAVLAAGLALALTACGDDDPTDTTAPGEEDTAAADLELIADGSLTVCSDVPYGLFEYEDADAPSGYAGFDMDLVQEIADRLDLELEILPTSFDAIESGSAMAAGQCDLAASAMTITEERANNIGFSDAYFETGQSLLLPEDSEFAGLADFEGDLGVQAATTGADYANENAPDTAQIVDLPDDPTLRQAIQAGTIAGILQDFEANAEILADLEGYEIVEVYETGEEYGFGTAVEGKENLLAAVNEQLDAIRADGTYEEIYDRYFGSN
jgi:polar amino acid transport system substrate-binding protein